MAATVTPVDSEQSEQQLKKMVKQLTGKRGDTPLHCAARAGRLDEVVATLDGTEEARVKDLLTKQNQCGETPLYAAAENGQVEVVQQLMRYYDPADAGIKARNGCDAFLIAAKQGDLGMLSFDDHEDTNPICDLFEYVGS